MGTVACAVSSAERGRHSTTIFQELVKMMVEHDLELAQQERTLKDAGHVVALRGGAYV